MEEDEDQETPEAKPKNPEEVCSFARARHARTHTCPTHRSPMKFVVTVQSTMRLPPRWYLAAFVLSQAHTYTSHRSISKVLQQRRRNKDRLWARERAGIPRPARPRPPAQARPTQSYQDPQDPIGQEPRTSISTFSKPLKLLSFQNKFILKAKILISSSSLI